MSENPEFVEALTSLSKAIEKLADAINNSSEKTAVSNRDVCDDEKQPHIASKYVHPTGLVGLYRVFKCGNCHMPNTLNKYCVDHFETFQCRYCGAATKFDEADELSEEESMMCISAELCIPINQSTEDLHIGSTVF